jgi:predicted Rossmann fold nucleotide-binding protein DprA/Smf involved in DNA uptake
LGPELDRLFRQEDAWHPDQIAEQLGHSAGKITSELARLEMEGKLRRLPGGFYARTPHPF